MKSINVIIPAAGTSQRYGDEKNKLFEKCGKGCVLTEAITPFLSFQEVSKVIVSINSSFFDEVMAWMSITHLDEDDRITLAIGGDTRTETVKGALRSLTDDCTHVLIHDGARPFVSADLIGRVISALDTHKGAVALLPLVDNVAGVTNGVQPLDRNDYRLVQTPAGFEKELFEKAYSSTTTSSLDDLTTIREVFDGEIAHVEGERKNRKITHKGDLSQNRVGCGYDIHRTVKGDGITLCGVKIPCKFSLVAHSDGDVPVHAIMDAILSAIGEKDIGHHFPVDDPKYDNADSLELLDTVVAMCHKKGYQVCNVSVTIIAERPKLAPYINEMRARTCVRLGVPEDCVGISATTNEQVGEIGKGKGIGAYATVLLVPME